jgi:hypothetical protein
MSTAHYFIFGIIGFMALVVIAIFVYRISSPSRVPSHPLEVGGIVPYLSLFGVLGFLAGTALLVYDQQRYMKIGLALTGCGWLSAMGSYYIARWMFRRKR